LKVIKPSVFEDVEIAEVMVEPQVASGRNFIESNTTEVTVSHLKNDCIIPVFRDNEKTVSHYEFINAVNFATREHFGNLDIMSPQIRVSHPINGRIPSALQKKVHELEDYEKTRYYERMMFVIEIPSITEQVHGNRLNLTIGGVRALNHESLFSKKSIEHFKVFIGFQNKVCTNLSVSTDGVMLDLRVSSYDDLIKKVFELIERFNIPKNLRMLNSFGYYRLTEHQFAQIIGKSRLYQYLPSQQRKLIPSLEFNDTQINSVARDYYLDKSFARDENGDINLWRLHNLFTGANKNSYIDAFLGRAVNATTFTSGVAAALEGDNRYAWFLS
jgi:hypothetical protein